MSRATIVVCLGLCLVGQVVHHASGHRHTDTADGLVRKLLQSFPPRFQDPTPPFPYFSSNVTFTSFSGPDVTLAGTLTLPNTPAPHPAVLLISGAGPTDRDANFFGHKWFLVLSDHLTRNGIAVLRYDDRGVGESTGDISTATTFDSANDAIGGIRYLKGRDDIDENAVGMLGHSEGGIIAPIAVSKLKETGKGEWMPSFLVLMAPPGARYVDIADQVLEKSSKSAGLGAEEVQATVEGNKKVVGLLQGADNVLDVKDEVEGVLREIESSFGKILDFGPNTTVETQVAFLVTPWYKTFLTINPVTFFEQVDLPVLVLLASRDVQVPPEFNEGPIRAGFANNTEANIVKVEGVNHQFQNAETGLLEEVGKIDETIAPAVLDIITNWVLERAE